MDYQLFWDLNKSTRPFPCPHDGCRRGFSRQRHLLEHLRTHTGEKPFRCTWRDCQATFTVSGSLKKHMRVHTGEKPYQCSWEGCNASFSLSSNLARHVRTHTAPSKQGDADLFGFSPSDAEEPFSVDKLLGEGDDQDLHDEFDSENGALRMGVESLGGLGGMDGGGGGLGELGTIGGSNRSHEIHGGMANGVMGDLISHAGMEGVRLQMVEGPGAVIGGGPSMNSTFGNSLEQHLGLGMLGVGGVGEVEMGVDGMGRVGVVGGEEGEGEDSEEEEEEEFYCEVVGCDEVFPDQEELNEHVALWHSGDSEGKSANERRGYVS